MNKSNTKGKNVKINKKAILGILAAIVIIAVIIIVIVNMKNSDNGSAVSVELNTEIWLNVNEEASLKNGSDKVILKIESELNYTEGSKEEFEVPYTLVVNNKEFKGVYTFATGYSIHSEPNDIPYKVSFKGIKQGAICIMISEK